MKFAMRLAPPAAIALCMLVAAAGIATAQTSVSSSTTPATSQHVLSIAEIEARMVAQGISIEEIEVRDLVAEVEGRDSAGREMELLVDRRSGDILSRKFDD